MYQDATDPWGFGERWYEQHRCAISLAQLPARRYRRAFEPGCSIGVLSALLAPRCDALLCYNVAAAAAAAAARRTSGLPHVRVEQGQIPARWPEGRFDLIVLSEVLYYFGDHDLEQVLKRAAAALEPDGTLLAVHWHHQVADYPRGPGTTSTARWPPRRASSPTWSAHQEPDFLAEVYLRTDGRPVSVAQAAGLA